MKLHEISQLPDQHTKIEQWLESVGIREYSIRPDGTVDITNNVNLKKFKGTTFPVQFGKTSGHFDCADTALTSLQGMPYSVNGYVDLYGTNIISLSGIHTIIKQIKGSFYCDAGKTNILGLLLIKGITEIDTENDAVNAIITKYIGRPDMIIEAQDELIDAGFKEQAKL